ncbi:MAG: porin [Bacteroidales bacterium]|nr:porin [Bacteroidales bacterium]
MKTRLLILIFILISLQLWASPLVDGSDTLQQNNHAEIGKKLIQHIQPYGSYRIYFGVNDDGYVGMADNSSRFGIISQLPIYNNLQALAGIELGARLVTQDETIIFRGDPGNQVGEANNTLFGRLGFVGFKYKFLSLTVGKQWSAYYDVAAYTDELLAFGGEGSATFNNYTDGGVTGTGRANQLFLLRVGNERLKAALQFQSRSISDSSQRIADTYGGSIQYLTKSGLKAGFAFVVTNDGVMSPNPQQPKYNDKSYVGSLAYISDKWYLAALFSKFEQHETVKINDTTTFFYDGAGAEIYLAYSFGSINQWKSAMAMNMLWPEKGQGINQYRMLYFVAELSYTYFEASQVFITVKQDFPRNIFGGAHNETIIAMGLRISFGY